MDYDHFSFIFEFQHICADVFHLVVGIEHGFFLGGQGGYFGLKLCDEGLELGQFMSVLLLFLRPLGQLKSVFLDFLPQNITFFLVATNQVLSLLLILFKLFQFLTKGLDSFLVFHGHGVNFLMQLFLLILQFGKSAFQDVVLLIALDDFILFHHAVVGFGLVSLSQIGYFYFHLGYLLLFLVYHCLCF